GARSHGPDRDQEPRGQGHGQRRAAGQCLRPAGQHPADPPGRERSAGRRPSGHPLHQDPRRGPRRWQEALPPEGHRSCPSGLDPCSQYTGGGIVHGPKPRDYSQRTPKKMKAAALRGALSDRARHGRIHVISEFVATDTKTKLTQTALKALRQVTESHKVLVVLAREEEHNRRALRNLQEVHLLDAGQVNTYDVLNSDDVIFTEAGYTEFLTRVNGASQAAESEEDAK